MNQPGVTKLVSKLRYKISERRKLRNIQGPQGRHNKIRKTVTALFKHERIELNYNRADEARGYAERLISDAIRYGDCHKETMEMASYWLLEKPLIHKLFKVLAPRYQNFPLSYTKMWRVSLATPKQPIIPKCVLELRNNVYPSLGPDKLHNKNLIHNVLLFEAKKVYDKKKAEKLVKEVHVDNVPKTDAEGKDTKGESLVEDAGEDKVMAAEGEKRFEETNASNLTSNETVSSNEMKADSVDKVSEPVPNERLIQEVESVDKESISKNSNTSLDEEINKMKISETKEEDSKK